jgi:hypothetical protein
LVLLGRKEVIDRLEWPKRPIVEPSRPIAVTGHAR